jgi:hypothetical protein
LIYTSSPFYSDYFGDGGLANYLTALALNCDLPDLNLPKEDYRCEPQVPSSFLHKKFAYFLSNLTFIFKNLTLLDKMYGIMLNRNVIVRRLESLLLLTGLINISPL